MIGSSWRGHSVRSEAPALSTLTTMTRPVRALTKFLKMADELPPGDTGLLAALQESAAFADVSSRLAVHEPLETWRVGTDHFFLFGLHPDERSPRPSYALFKMIWEEDEPLVAAEITPSEDGGEAEVRQIRQPDVVQVLRVD